jgi:dCTP deaminase
MHFVTPLIDPVVQLGPSSLDVRLGTELRTTRTVSVTHVDLTKNVEELQRRIADYFEPQRAASGEEFVLHPGQFALAATLEYIRLPPDIAGRIEGRSSFGRLGLQVHATAGFIDPGFEGTLTFELINAGNLPTSFSPGLRLGQVCFFGIKAAEIPYMSKAHGKYGGRLSVETSRIAQDPKIR